MLGNWAKIQGKKFLQGGLPKWLQRKLRRKPLRRKRSKRCEARASLIFFTKKRASVHSSHGGLFRFDYGCPSRCGSQVPFVGCIGSGGTCNRCGALKSKKPFCGSVMSVAVASR